MPVADYNEHRLILKPVRINQTSEAFIIPKRMVKLDRESSYEIILRRLR